MMPDSDAEGTGFDRFAGTEEPPAHLRIDAARLRDWLRDRLPGFEHEIAVAKFRGGQSNPTYRLDTRAGAYVLRRKPPGPLRPTAHAIDREFRVLRALAGTAVPIARPHLYCEDAEVIGSEFYIVDVVEGTVHWNCELPDCTPGYRTAYFTDLVRQLGKVHALDWKGLGLTGFGREGNFVPRNLERWTRTYEDTQAQRIPDMDWLAGALRERLPAAEPSCLIHGEYGNHNVIAAPDAPRIAAIIDWELATIGNPYVDLAHMLRPWMEPPEPSTGRPTLADKDLARSGIPTLERMIALHGEATGLAWADGRFYLAFVMYRYAAMVQGVLHRYKVGTAGNVRVSHSQQRVVEIAGKARAILEQPA